IGLIAAGASLAVRAHDAGNTRVSSKLHSVSPPAPVTPPGNVGASAQAEGVVALIHGDDFVHGRSTHQFVVHDNGRDTPFRFAGQIPALGARVRLEGNTAADGVLELGSAPTVLEPAPTPAASTGTQNAIFILVRFLDSGSLPFAQSDVQAVAVTNGNSVA